jgi:predicted DNA-binding WGR domain protein
MKVWGRIGARGHLVGEPYDTEALADAALHRQVERKRRRGYTEQAEAHNHQKREAILRRDHGDDTLAEIGRSYNVSAATIARLAL